MRYLNDLQPVRRYLELKAEREAIDAELEELKPLLLAATMEEDGERYSLDGYEFTVTRRRAYSYSARVEQLGDELKALKKLEQANGTARLEKQQAILVCKAERR